MIERVTLPFNEEPWKKIIQFLLNIKQMLAYLNKPETDQIAQKKNIHPRLKFKQGGQRKGVELVLPGPDAAFQQGTTHTHTHCIDSLNCSLSDTPSKVLSLKDVSSQPSPMPQY